MDYLDNAVKGEGEELRNTFKQISFEDIFGKEVPAVGT